MPVLAELFLSLAGFQTDLEKDEFDHPAEFEVYEIAASFGRGYASLRDTCAIRSDALAAVIEEKILHPYLRKLADIEQDAIATMSMVEPLSRAIFASAQLLTQTVDLWKVRFSFAEHLLMQFPEHGLKDTSAIENLQAVCRSQAGRDDMVDIIQACLLELDRTWVDDIVSAFTSYTFPADRLERLSQHPVFTGTKIPITIVEIGGLLATIGDIGATSSTGHCVPQFIEALSSNATLLQSLKVPLDPSAASDVFLTIHTNLARIVKSFLSSHKVQKMLAILRNIILFGSASWTTEFCDSKGDVGLALPRYFQLNNELGEEAYELASKTLGIDSAHSKMQLRVSPALSVLFPPQLCKVYETLFEWFAEIIVAIDSIGLRSEAAARRYKIVLSLIWKHQQESVDRTMRELEEIIEQGHGFISISQQGRLRSDLLHGALLDPATVSASIRKALSDIHDNNLMSLETLVTELDAYPSLKELELPRLL